MKIVLLSLFTFIFFSANSQSFFKALPKPVSRGIKGPSLAAPESGVLEMNAVRPVVAFATYSEPGHILMAGAGVSYEHLKWDTQADKYKSTYSISALIFGGAGINASGPDQPAAITYGVLVGFFNNLINFGPTYNFGIKKVGLAVGIGIPLNN